MIIIRNSQSLLIFLSISFAYGGKYTCLLSMQPSLKKFIDESNYSLGPRIIGNVDQAASPAFYNNHQLKMIEAQAFGGDKESIYTLGISHLLGHGVSEDQSKALKFLLASAGMGNHRAQYATGVMYYERGQLDIACYWWKEMLAEKILYPDLQRPGYGQALNNLGCAFTTSNPDIALKYFEWSAEQNDPDGQYNLGLLLCKQPSINNEREYNVQQAIYALDKAMSQDHSAAQALLKKMAGNNYGLAQLKLGIWYYESSQERKIKKKAFKWLCHAFDQKPLAGPAEDLGKGAYYLAQLWIDLENNRPQSLKFFKQAADLGCSKAYEKLGNCLGYGFGCKISISEAMKYFKMAAQVGNVDELLDYAQSLYTDKHYDNAISLLEDTALTQNIKAHYLLSLSYIAKNDYTQAIEQLIPLADTNYKDSRYLLGRCYRLAGRLTELELFLRESIEQNIPGSPYDLGYLLIQEKDARKIQEGMQLLRAGDQGNDHRASYLLAICSMHSIGGTSNPVLVERLLGKVVYQKHKMSDTDISLLFFEQQKERPEYTAAVKRILDGAQRMPLAPLKLLLELTIREIRLLVNETRKEKSNQAELADPQIKDLLGALTLTTNELKKVNTCQADQ